MSYQLIKMGDYKQLLINNVIVCSPPLDQDVYLVGSYLEPRSDHIHKGVDLAATKPLSIYACVTARVITSGYSKSAGYWIRMDRDNLRFIYMHMTKDLQVGYGDIVNAGTVIGYMGNSGSSQGRHLHFEVRQRTPSGSYVAINPTPFVFATPDALNFVKSTLDPT